MHLYLFVPLPLRFTTDSGWSFSSDIIYHVCVKGVQSAIQLGNLEVALMIINIMQVIICDVIYHLSQLICTNQLQIIKKKILCISLSPRISTVKILKLCHRAFPHIQIFNNKTMLSLFFPEIHVGFSVTFKSQQTYYLFHAQECFSSQTVMLSALRFLLWDRFFMNQV